MASHKEINPMLTTSDVARFLNVHINTVRRWSNQGILKTYRIGSRGDRRFERQDIAGFLLEKSKIANEGEESEYSPSTDQALDGGTNLLDDRRGINIILK